LRLSTRRLRLSRHESLLVLRPVRQLADQLAPSLSDATFPFQRKSQANSRENILIHRRVPGEIDKDVALGLFRVVQEALSNAIKHSGAGEAKVELMGGSQEIHLRISDSGAGFRVEDVREKGGLGLVSMQERLRLMGGELWIESEPRRGTRIEARVPLTPPGTLR
jgi:signal transduction histidine kinase